MTTRDPQRWARIERILDALLDATAPERAALLDAECADDAGLRAEVARLLASCESAANHFESPPLLVARDVADAADRATRDDVVPDQRVGAYRVVRLLGRGGMGAVYLAERADGAFRREVALKIVKRGMDTDEIVDRFRRERQILARLQHANIAGLLDGGITENGLPYFVMELAPGEPIDRWCDDNRLTVDERLRLFLAVCHAVQYAHRNLIVHRDLKPGNILVSADGLKLLDFGIAKLLHVDAADPVPATRRQERRLTPEYAAPEQVRGEPTTTATDVYALGVILYELLTGRRPYRLEGTLADIERTVCDSDPKSPSSVVTRVEDRDSAIVIAERRRTRPDLLRARLDGDLDAIVLQALQKEPDRRYPSVEALAEDISRHLDGRPVVARPDTRWYRISKFVRRNRLPVALASGAVLTLIAGSIAVLLFAGIAVFERNKAERALAGRTAASDFLVETFGEFDPDRLAGDTLFTRDELIQKSLENLASFPGPAEVRAVIANTLGRLFFNLGEHDRADSLFREAHDILVRLDPAPPDLAASMMGMGDVALRQRNFNDAERWFRAALDARQRTLEAGEPAIAETLVALAFALYTQHATEMSAEADSLYTHVLSFENITPQMRGRALEGLGDLRLWERRFAEAESFYRRALELRAPGDSAVDPSTARLVWGLAAARDSLGHLEDAARHYENVLHVLEKYYGSNHPDVAIANYNLGYALFRLDRFPEAEARMAAAAAIYREVNAPDVYRSDALTFLGRIRTRMGRNADAVIALDSALSVLAPGRRPPDPSTDAAQRYYVTRYWYGVALAGTGREDEAIPILREAWAMLSGPLQAHDAARNAAGELAALYRRLGMADSASVYAARSSARSPGGT